MQRNHCFRIIFVSFLFFPLTLASSGDRSPFYQNCLESCGGNNCSSNGMKYKKSLENEQSSINKLLFWSCQDECKYECMWKTVDSFVERGWNIPKFHGKWPFKRVLGIQELGSVIGSILNLVAHLFMYNEMMSLFSHKNTPLLWLWQFFAVVCVNGWIWSIIFHTRDTPFTEFMDYACAMSMIMVLLITCGVRLLFFKWRLFSFVFVAACLLYYVDHVVYLFKGQVDYEYNMLANIIPGAIACTIWTLWAAWKYTRNEKYVWRIIWFNVLTSVLMTLELFDFPPYLYLWDAHALWHMSTSVLPSIFYRFVFDDLKYLRQHWPNVESKTMTKQL